MIAEGQPAPDFTLDNQSGHSVSLSQFRGRPVVLYFYPRDNTPACTEQACGFRDARKDYETAGAVVLGVSPDTASSHQKFAHQQDLAFDLLADPDKAVIHAYDVWKEKTLYGRKSMGVERTTFLIDKDGIVRKIFPRVRVKGHAGRVLAAIKEL